MAARPVWEPIMIGVAVASLIIGNFAAIGQNNLKRLLAYSSISHAGYMLLGLIAGNKTGIGGVIVYLLVYTFMTLGAFLVIAAMRRAGIMGEDMDDFAGLMKRHPSYALWMLVFLLSLAGIPPTAGFLGKYYIFLSLMETGHYTLAVVAALFVGISLFYYFRIVKAMFLTEGEETVPLVESFGTRFAVAATGALTLIIGLYPEPFLRFANVFAQGAH
jgi:NADH-quinone oxidoreductase subunit N